MLPLYRRAAAAAALLLLPVSAAIAQSHVPQQTQISIQYHEMIPAGGDTNPVILKILDRLRQDCELVGKAFSRKCVISQININMNTNYGGDTGGMRNLNANATIILPPEPVEMTPPAR